MKNITLFLSALVALLFSVAESSAQITPPYYNPANVNITGGNINGAVIGGTTAAAGSFTTLSATGNATVGPGGATGTDAAFTINSGNGAGGEAILALARNSSTAGMLYHDGSIMWLRELTGGDVAIYGNTNFSLGGRLQVGSGSTTSAGLIAGYLGSSGYGAIWSTGVTPSSSNYSFASNGSITAFSGSSNANLNVNSVARVSANTTGVTFAGDMIYDKTITAAGTTGAQTINKTTGRVNFAAAATSLVVTNSLVTANSIVHCSVATNDTTMKSAACVPTAGSFTIYGNAAATAETAVAFTVTN